MATSKDRQRALARAKLERQMARRAASARRRRQIQAGVGVFVALALVVLGTVWLVNNYTKDDGKKATPAAESTAATTPGPCKYTKAAARDGLKDVGVPTAGKEPRSGTQPMTITTNQGVVEVQMDLAKAPCTAASFAYLAGKKFFDNTKCHRLTTKDSGLSVLQCGDPSGTGSGGPSYTIGDENLPTQTGVTYPKGTVAIANTGQPGSGSSQFFIVYADTTLPPNYAILGTVSKGLEIIEKVGKAGAVKDGKAAADGAPKLPVNIKSIRVGAPVADSADASPSASAAPSASNSAS